MHYKMLRELDKQYFTVCGLKIDSFSLEKPVNFESTYCIMQYDGTNDSLRSKVLTDAFVFSCAFQRTNT